MKKFFLALVLFLCFRLETPAQWEYRFGGYVNEMPALQLLAPRFASLYRMPVNAAMSLSRIRLKPVFYLWEGARINLAAEADLLYYKDLTEFVVLSDEKTNRQIVNLKYKYDNDKNLVALGFIDRFYLKQSFSKVSFVIGRQRISWGTGRIWNPTDLFNPINPTTFYKTEKDGADAISSKISFGNFTDLTLVLNPLRETSNYGFRFRTNFWETDFSVMGGRFDDKDVLGFDFAGNLGDAGIRGEGIYSSNATTKGVFKYILGADYQFSASVYALIEYHFNGEGEKEKRRYNFFKLMRGDILNLARNYLALNSVINATPLLILTFTNINNLDDASGFFGFRANYSLTENSYLNFGLQYFYGEKFTEYWYYPDAMYFLLEYYF